MIGNATVARWTRMAKSEMDKWLSYPDCRMTETSDVFTSQIPGQDGINGSTL